MKFRPAAALGLLTAINLWAQSPIAFEVATIKPSAPMTPEALQAGKLRLGTKIDDARADIGSATPVNLICRAYHVRPFQVSGPDWLERARFDIVGKLPQGSKPEQVPEMLQALLADRFKLSFRREEREFPVYALVTAKDGPGLRRRPDDYDPKAPTSDRPMTLPDFAEALTLVLDRPVLDQTRLQGEYMFELATIIKERSRQLNRAAGPADTASDPVSSDLSGMLRTIGLKLEARKASLPVLVIEHMEKNPAEN